MKKLPTGVPFVSLKNSSVTGSERSLGEGVVEVVGVGLGEEGEAGDTGEEAEEKMTITVTEKMAGLHKKSPKRSEKEHKQSGFIR